jgi:transposase-like protein
MKAISPRKETKTRKSAEQWQAIMLAYDDSGLTQEDFCIRESLALSTFYKWRQQLTGGKPKRRDQKEPMFVELGSVQGADKKKHWDLELSLGDGIVLRLSQTI